MSAALLVAVLLAPVVAAAQAKPAPLLATLVACDDLLRVATVDDSAVAQCLLQAKDLLLRALAAERSAQPSDFASTCVGGAPSLACIFEDAAFLADTLDVLVGEGDAKHARARLNASVVALRRRIAAYKAIAQPRFTLVSQGGVSLGSWQAGVLYVLTEYLKKERRQGQEQLLTTITGASAGAINGLLAASAGCEAPNPVPTASAFYETWAALGLLGRGGMPGLLPDESTPPTPHGAFTLASLERTLENARAHLSKAGRYPRACKVDYGFAVTHLTQRSVPIHLDEDGTPLVTGSSLQEKFALRLEFDPSFVAIPKTERVALRAYNLKPPDAIHVPFAASGRAPALALLGTAPSYGSPVRTQTVLEAVRASGAFPGAFPPVTLPFRPIDPKGAIREVHTAEFVDGGVFDNTPVSLAASLDAWRESETAMEPGSPLLDDLVPSNARTYVLVDPNVVDFTLGNPPGGTHAGNESSGIAATYLRFVQRMLGASMDAAIIGAAERFSFLRSFEPHDGLKPVLAIPRRHMPVTGALLAHFMAFLERDFREIDFYLGMADAVEFVRREPRLRQVAAHPITLDGAAYWSNLARDDKFSCVLAFYAEDLGTSTPVASGDLPTACERLGEQSPPSDSRDDDVEAFYDTLRTVPDEVDGERREAALRGGRILGDANFRALLVALHNHRLWMQSSGSAGYRSDHELEAFFGALGSASFRFVDLAELSGKRGPTTLSYDEALTALRAVTQDAIDALSDQQPSSGEQALIGVGGRVIADQAIEPLRPDIAVGVGLALNGIEGTLGFTTWDWLRLDFVGRLFRLRSTQLFEDDRILAFDAAASFDAMFVIPTWWASLDVELGPGATFSQTFAFERTAFASRRAGPRAVLGLVLLQRLYVRVAQELFLHRHIASELDGALIPLTHRAQFSGSAGFRFLW